MSYQYSNNASATLASGITSGSTTLTVSTGSGILFPVLSGGNVFRATIVDAATQTLREIVQATATAGDTFTITRAQEGTTARAYNAGDIFYLDITAAQAADYFSKTFDTFPNQTGRLINIQTITTTGTYTPTAGTNSIIFYLVGGGGGGGGTSATTSTQAAAGSGGSAGGVAIHRATSGFSGQTITIGGGGAVVPGSPGGTGGTSSFLGITCLGGLGGNFGPAVTSSTVTIGAGVTSVTGANIANVQGESGHYGLILSLNACVGGSGGGNYLTPFTIAVARTINGSNGVSGLFPGGGGSGASCPSNGGSQSAFAGGIGAAGVCIIYEYA